MFVQALMQILERYRLSLLMEKDLEITSKFPGVKTFDFERSYVSMDLQVLSDPEHWAPPQAARSRIWNEEERLLEKVCPVGSQCLHYGQDHFSLDAVFLFIAIRPISLCLP